MPAINRRRRLALGRHQGEKCRRSGYHPPYRPHLFISLCPITPPFSPHLSKVAVLLSISHYYYYYHHYCCSNSLTALFPQHVNPPYSILMNICTCTLLYLGLAFDSLLCAPINVTHILEAIPPPPPPCVMSGHG